MTPAVLASASFLRLLVLMHCPHALSSRLSPLRRLQPEEIPLVDLYACASPSSRHAFVSSPHARKGSSNGGSSSSSSSSSSSGGGGGGGGGSSGSGSAEALESECLRLGLRLGDVQQRSERERCASLWGHIYILVGS
jgi:uncharacterized membrane protein YgcG